MTGPVLPRRARAGQLAPALALAMRSMRRHRWRQVLMSALLGLTVAAYLLYGTFLVGAGHEASLAIGRFALPCDVALLSSRTGLTDEVLADWSRRGGVAWLSAGRLTWYHTSLGALRVLALPADSPLWAAAGRGDAAGGGAPLPGRYEIVLPATLAGAGAEVGTALPLIPPRAPLGRVDARVIGFHQAQDHLLGDLALALMARPGPLPNCLFIDAWTDTAAASLASALEVEFVGPRRPVLARPGDPTVWWKGTADDLRRAVLSGAYMPGASVMALVFGFCATGLLTMNSLAFLDRKRELAILKTVGLESPGVTAMLLAEQAVVAVAGSALAVMVAVAAIPWLGAFLPDGAVLRAGTVAQGVLAGVMVLGAGVLAPATAARVASVNQLLYDQPIPLERRKVRASDEK